MNYLIIPAYQPDLNLVKLVRLVHAKSDLQHHRGRRWE